MNILSWFQFFYFSGGHIRKKIKSDGNILKNYIKNQKWVKNISNIYIYQNVYLKLIFKTTQFFLVDLTWIHPIGGKESRGKADGISSHLGFPESKMLT